MPLAGLIDLDVERARLDKERRQGRGRGAEGRRPSSETPTSSARAKPEVVEENRERLAGSQ